MHVPDGFLDAPTSIATGVVAAVAVGVALKGARRELDDRTAPMAGLVAAFIFATQMINFPVGVGTSGHLLGGALAAILVGPFTGLLCMTCVLIVQSLLFADGGITALGTNIDLMGVTTVALGWLAFVAARAILPKRTSSVAPAAAFAALLTVPASAMVFVLLYSLGGTADIPIDTLAAAMLGVHLVVGAGEAVITFFAIASIVAVRPDLIYGARPLIARRELEVRVSEASA
ncbi:energy-coupling factor ABC transporter permease [Nocardioides sp.]|uniref:energy-coupling factor ABC transporter permease n=1 Tax=Nocardioides sp. TaxID=35761 RepID=UPI0035670712